jgi:hypothetical protein
MFAERYALLLSPQESDGRRSYYLVEDRRAIYEQCKAKDLEPFERLPAKSKRDNPDEKCPAGINGTARGSGNAAGDAQAEEVEAAVERISTDTTRQERSKLTQC